MRIIRFLLPALLLALAANLAHAQSKDKLDKSRGTVDNTRQADPPRPQPGTTADRASEARWQKDAEQRAHAERFPPMPSAAPPAPSKASSSSDKGK